MHRGAQGRLCFLKNSGDPDDFLFWWFTENTHKICVSEKCLSANYSLDQPQTENTALCTGLICVRKSQSGNPIGKALVIINRQL